MVSFLKNVDVDLPPVELYRLARAVLQVEVQQGGKLHRAREAPATQVRPASSSPTSHRLTRSSAAHCDDARVEGGRSSSVPGVGAPSHLTVMFSPYSARADDRERSADVDDALDLAAVQPTDCRPTTVIERAVRFTTSGMMTAMPGMRRDRPGVGQRVLLAVDPQRADVLTSASGCTRRRRAPRWPANGCSRRRSIRRPATPGRCGRGCGTRPHAA